MFMTKTDHKTAGIMQTEGNFLIEGFCGTSG